MIPQFLEFVEYHIVHNFILIETISECNLLSVCILQETVNKSKENVNKMAPGKQEKIKRSIVSSLESSFSGFFNF